MKTFKKTFMKTMHISIPELLVNCKRCTGFPTQPEGSGLLGAGYVFDFHPYTVRLIKLWNMKTTVNLKLRF